MAFRNILSANASMGDPLGDPMRKVNERVNTFRESERCTTCHGIHLSGSCPLIGMTRQPNGTYTLSLRERAKTGR